MTMTTKNCDWERGDNEDVSNEANYNRCERGNGTKR